jgi:WD40-like Beta Propeller Repeat
VGVTDFLRNNRYASVIITTVLLVVVGLVVSLARSDRPDNSGLTLRADQQALQPQTTDALPPASAPPVGAAATVATLKPLKLGKIPSLPRAGASSSKQPSSATGGGTSKGTGGGGNSTDTTATTAGGGGTSPTTLYAKPPSNAFAPGRIAFSAGGSVWTVNPDGSDARQVATNAYFPAWAKDHSVIAVADGDGAGGALSLVTPAGDRLGLTTGAVDDAQPAWSPDGTKLAFARIDKTAAVDGSAIWVINRDGSNLRKIAAPSPCLSRDPAWSPDGKKIAFWSSRDHCDEAAADFGDYTLYVYDLLTGVTTALGDATTNRAAPAWSPDGKKLAFASDGDGGVGFEICVMNADGTGAARITNASGHDTDPSWSPDGRKIAFRSERNGGGIFVMNADGSSPTMLVGGASHPAWS